MKKYQKWMIGEVGILGVSGTAGYMATHVLSQSINLSDFWAIVAGTVVFWHSSNFLLKWYHSGVTIEDKFYNGGDDV